MMNLREAEVKIVAEKSPSVKKKRKKKRLS